MIKKQAINELLIKLLECFRSRGQWLFTFIGKKDSFYILKEKRPVYRAPLPSGKKIPIFPEGRANVHRQGARILGTEKNQINTFISLH